MARPQTQTSLLPPQLLTLGLACSCHSINVSKPALGTSRLSLTRSHGPVASTPSTEEKANGSSYKVWEAETSREAVD